LGSRFRKGAIVVIDVQLVSAVAIFHVARVANVHIEPAIVIEIYHYGAGAPHAILLHAAFCRNVFKFEIAFIQVQLVFSHVGCEQYIGQAIIVDVTYGHAAPIVKITEQEAVVILLVYYLVIEFDTGIFHQLEQA
jgi:hypothetical protein